MDETGLQTLELFMGADAFNRWMFGAVASRVRGRILEIGSGIGNMSDMLLEQGGPVVLTDVDAGYCAQLRESYAGIGNLEGVLQLDWGKPLAAGKAGDGETELLLRGGFDTIITFNVVEHIEDDRQVVANAARLLRPGGRLIILVPAGPWLYNRLDEGLGHFRRYNKKELRALLEGEGLRVTHSRYFNAAGILGWWAAGTLMKDQAITPGKLKIFNFFLPLIKVADQLLNRIGGLSVIAVAERG